MYCKNCGKEIDDKAVVCPNCGVAASEIYFAKPQIVDEGSLGWGILGCCIPIVGLILFLVWKDIKPKSSKNAGIGAIVGVGCFIAIYALIFLFAMGMASADMYY